MNYISLFVLALILGCIPSKQMKQTEQNTLTFLALGDSYTIGEAVSEADRWPDQLVDRLKDAGLNISKPRIVATTGWTTDDLQNGIAAAKISTTYDLVSLLIGVNNQYRGYDMEVYKKEFLELLNQAIEFADGKSENVFVLSIPDYSVTPFAENNNLNPDKTSSELAKYDSEAKKICNSHGVVFFEITEWSRKAAIDPSLVASDGLHPSGKMYTNWVDTCYEWVHKNLSGR